VEIIARTEFDALLLESGFPGFRFSVELCPIHKLFEQFKLGNAAKITTVWIQS
jgi:hypothetical protein